MRLASLVVFSAAMTFLLGSGDSIDWVKFAWLLTGGVLITGSSNAFNQIMERELDKLMERTSNRPLPDYRMSLTEAYAVALVSGLGGSFILYYFVNFYSGILGTIALFSYVFAYTPLKRITPFAVFVGAIPGAIPTALGYIAATNTLSFEAFILFALQFFWQFPHFWAIAWVVNDDYLKAGFELLPTRKRDKGSAMQTVVYTLALLPVSIMPWLVKLSGVYSMVVLVIMALWFLYKALVLYNECSIEAARKLMFASFVYLPIVLIALVLDKI
ncbi:MAG: protoheme IX farnesyltransferase [Bacteroidia bacterium]|nr:protoheme IX farnesyltransferase [Bacteroidia bacterium]